ncbi:MAG: phosphoribosylamine--glycine ligase [Actinomycetota bacterium]|nr:phosphoribosylamine--glycine ligase [Actinomycetota bacterium]
MRVLVVGGGGREHALVSGLVESSSVDEVLAAPGNAGIGEIARRLPIAADDLDGLVDVVESEAVDLTVVGPEVPLVAGLADRLRDRGHPVVGPGAAAARIEGSKAWAKELCERHGIPAGGSHSFTDADEAIAALGAMAPPYVVKADGLAAGKGVTVTPDRADAERAIRAALVDRAFGDAGARVVIEEFLEGREVSAFALTDGVDVVPLGFARDFKRAEDGDEGPNTGGMGAYAPDPALGKTATLIEETILHRTAEALRDEGEPFIGVLYAGLMLTSDGPKVLEYNCRLGDPEAEVLLPRLDSDLGHLFQAAADGRLGEARGAIRWSDDVCVTVVLVSGGYPGEYRTGFPVGGLDDAAGVPGVRMFHSGTEMRDGRVVTAGGRVLSVTGRGSTAAEARARAYEASALISFEGMRYRKDIAAGVET